MGNYHGLIVYFYKKKRLCKNSLSYHFRLNPESHPGLIINAQDEVVNQVCHNKINFRQPPAIRYSSPGLSSSPPPAPSPVSHIYHTLYVMFISACKAKCDRVIENSGKQWKEINRC